MPTDTVFDALKTPSASLSAPNEFQHTTVLIIDDDPVYRILLRDLCAKIGIGHIVEATDGAQGLACVSSVKPDLILLDIVMPGINGIEVCRALRNLPVTADTAILIQTGVTDENKRLEGFQAGATDYISKPLQLPEFMARARTHLRNALYIRHLAEFHSRIEGHLNTANSFLKALLPDHQAARDLATRNGFTLSVAQKNHEEIGGDLWYLHEIKPGRLLLIILDPNAAGLAGAINAMRVDTVLREIWRTVDDPQQLLHALDQVMAQSPCGRLFASVTAVLVDRSEGSLWYTSSGNPYPIFCRAEDKNVSALVSGGLPLGSGMAALELNHSPMNIGDVLVLHSDGWPTQNLDHPLDLIQNSLDHGAVHAEALLDPIAPTSDDATIITLHRAR